MFFYSDDLFSFAKIKIIGGMEVKYWGGGGGFAALIIRRGYPIIGSGYISYNYGH